MKITLVRHGETEWNRLRRFQGQIDIDLNDLGREQARLVGLALAKRDDIEGIYASDLMRAWHTAESIAAHHTEIPFVADKRLREISFGPWEGKSYSDLTPDEKGTFRAWRHNAVEENVPGVEPMTDLAARLTGFVDELRQNHPADASLCLVAHGGSIRTLVCAVMGFDLAKAWHMQTENTSITELEIRAEGPPVLHKLNDYAHLANLT